MESLECKQEGVLLVDKSAQGVVTLTLNNQGTHNALEPRMIQALLCACRAIAKDETVRLVHLTSTGKHFCAGADLNWMRESAELTQEDNYQDSLQLAQCLHALNTLPVPTLCSVQGACYGGAVGLVCCCDIVLASDSARFCLSEVSLGLIPAVISPYVVHALGKRVALSLMLLAKPLNASEAKAMGLIHQIHTNPQLQTQVQQTIGHLLHNGPLALKLTKQLVKQLGEMSEESIEKTQKMTAELIANIRTSPEAQEGMAAFLAKRKPEWE